MRFVQSTSGHSNHAPRYGVAAVGVDTALGISASLRTCAPRCVRIALLSETLSLLIVFSSLSVVPLAIGQVHFIHSFLPLPAPNVAC